VRALTRRRAPWATAAPAPEPVFYTQDQQRERRRKGLPICYRGDFDLVKEVSAIVEPLAVQLAQLSGPVVLRSGVYDGPLVLRRRVDEVSDGVGELVSAVIGMLAESRLDAAAQARVVASVRDLAQRPREPQITDEMVLSGRWAAVLVKHVVPHSNDLAALLGRALRPGHPNLRGDLSVSERLEDALRVLDVAARDLARRIPKVLAYQALPTPEENYAAHIARQEQERVQREVQRALAKMKGPKR
jgi:hypothetical protein